MKIMGPLLTRIKKERKNVVKKFLFIYFFNNYYSIKNFIISNIILKINIY